MELQEKKPYVPTDCCLEVDALIRRARAAQIVFADQGQQVLDDAVAAVGWAIMEPQRNRQLAEMAVHDTGLGNVEDKIKKNYRKTLGLLRDLQGVRSTGVIAQNDAPGITEIGRAVGVVAAITPSTNPAATPANKIINALKCGNAVIIAPSPKGLGACELLVQFIHAEFEKCGLSKDLVQVLPAPISKAMTTELMRQADLVVATGSQSNVRLAYTCGTPAFGVGAGNVASIVDTSANLAEAAEKIIQSKTFDNATSCSSENSVVILDSVYDAMLDALRARDAVLLAPEERQNLLDAMWLDGRLNPAITGKGAAHIARLVGMDLTDRIAAEACSVLLVEEQGIGEDYPFSGEKLSPVLAVYRARDFADASLIVSRLYAYMGAGHSVSLHSTDADQALLLGQTLPVSRVIVNQAHCFATGGNFDNSLPFSLSMGCGTWGGNNFSDNMSYRHYMNTTRVVSRVAERKPSNEDVLGSYFARYGA
ncbi:aldehyde dehydrogenase family protein [Pusillimonas sp. ANT_WB101]|uniref:acylating sulfoacetaldehyde dehydrogenase n=1 Tax=Pusillimonas sp. ANT_WB101 TaxID=2597356 RepID=UPI0011ED5E7E|nr:aldehyde dehydrogenase family protein [Pusillimonas sp. ANT_WB101]KAA0912034.1 aldehyde dehydrogenase family protein [Pusillimonas sp. ANT_WB101]